MNPLSHPPACGQRLAEPPAHCLPGSKPSSSHWDNTCTESVYRETHDRLIPSLTAPTAVSLSHPHVDGSLLNRLRTDCQASHREFALGHYLLGVSLPRDAQWLEPLSLSAHAAVDSLSHPLVDRGFLNCLRTACLTASR